MLGVILQSHSKCLKSAYLGFTTIDSVKQKKSLAPTGFLVNESVCCEEINNLGTNTQRPPLLVLSQCLGQHVIDIIVFNFKKDSFRKELELEFS